MRYLSYYEEFPIYEPAEGGYYYPGNQLINSERLSKRQAKRKFEEIWEECLKENDENGFLRDYSNCEELRKSAGLFPWYRCGNYICKNSGYIGGRISYIIERKMGSQESGWKPYC